MRIRASGVQISVSVKRNAPRASHRIQVALFVPPDPSEESRGLCVTLGSTVRRARLFDPIIKDAAKRHKVDPALVKAIIMAESGYNPFAISQKGAQGLMQLMPETARDLGVENSFTRHTMSTPACVISNNF